MKLIEDASAAMSPRWGADYAMRLLPWRTVLGAVVHKRELGSQKVDVVAGVCIGGCQRGQDSHDAHKQASAAEGRHGDELQRLRWRGFELVLEREEVEAAQAELSRLEAPASQHQVRTAARFLARNKVVIESAGGLGQPWNPQVPQQPPTPPCCLIGTAVHQLWTCWNTARYKTRGDDQCVRACTDAACRPYLACTAETAGRALSFLRVFAVT